MKNEVTLTVTIDCNDNDILNALTKELVRISKEAQEKFKADVDKSGTVGAVSDERFLAWKTFAVCEEILHHMAGNEVTP